MFEKIEKALTKIVGTVSIISYAGIFFVMVLIVLDVMLRFFLGKPIMGSYEIVERVEMCLVFASFAYTSMEHSHVHVSMLIMYMPRKCRLTSYALTELVCGVMAAVVAYAATIQAQTASASGYTTGVLFIPLAPFYWIEAFCMLVFALALFFEGARALRAIGDQALASEIEKSWS